MPSTHTLICPSCTAGNRLPAARLSDGPKCGTCGARLVPPKPFELDPAALKKSVKTDTLPLLVDFWAPWCGPCRMMAPEFEKAAQALSGAVRLAKVNTQDFPEASTAYAIRGIPALLLFDKGREVSRLAGARPAADIIAFARQNAPA
ncbi:thioredoxin TrxC [Vannielia litorea]|uniref:Thioredoxin n=1 Tax=Vannielia litorea TaxID=1217970 RepID=A0A1N6GRW1_9RHOB|nr:thioredoxin TrxC [Vannielia litorea]SIO10268.1 thioredoxin [Vannielia litorea]